MARFVYENYPVWKLPEDLREGFDPEGLVTVTIETYDDDGQSPDPVEHPVAKETADR